jgi:hypothetical protein
MKLTIISDKGVPMMVINGIRKKGRSIEITGSLMGAWPAKMYITTKEFGGFIRAALNPGLLLYIFMYPFYFIAEKIGGSKK